MAKAESPALYVVLESFVGQLDGVDVTYRKGEPIHPDDPGLRKWPKAFGPFAFPHPVRSGFAERMAEAKAAKALTTPELRAE
jgi:hypothetical protein